MEYCCSWTHLHFLYPGATTVLPSLLLTAHQKTGLKSALKNSMKSSYGTPFPVTMCSKRGDTFLPMLFSVLLLEMVIKILTLPWLRHRFFSAEKELKGRGQKLFKPNTTLDLRKNSVDFSRFFLLAGAGNKP